MRRATPRLHWSREEDEILVEKGRDLTAARLALPGRSYAAIRARAQGMGLRPKRHTWTGAEVAEVRRLRAQGLDWQAISEALPHLPLRTVRHYAERPRPPLRQLNVPILDEVRRRASERGVSLRSLDQAIGCRSWYFKKGFKDVRLNWIAAAVAHLGGKVVIAWDD